MKRLVLILGIATLPLFACDGGGSGTPTKDTFPYPTGQVVDRRYVNGGWWLQLSNVVPHQGEVHGWQPVSHTQFNNCDNGDKWREDDPQGCS